jgi:hypothetical protein
MEFMFAFWFRYVTNTAFNNPHLQSMLSRIQATPSNFMNGSAEQYASIPVRAAGGFHWGWWQEGINVEVNKLFFVTRFFVKHLEKQNIDLARHCSRDQNIQQDRHCQNHYLTMPCWHKLLVSQH